MDEAGALRGGVVNIHIDSTLSVDVSQDIWL